MVTAVQNAPTRRMPNEADRTLAEAIRRVQMREEQVAQRRIHDKAIATTLQRGETLFLDGYTIRPAATTGVWIVTTPEELDKKTGELFVTEYTVDLLSNSCNCPLFPYKGVCKHVHGTSKLIAAYQQALREAEALLTPSVPATPTSPPIAPMEWIVNGRRFTDKGAADRYRKYLDFA